MKRKTTLKTVQLNRNVILNAAEEILGTYGLPDLSMRRLATVLGVAPGALYWHFPNKQALLGGIAQRLVSEVSTPEAHGDARMYCEELFQAVTSVRDGAEIMLAAVASETLDRDIHDELSSLVGTQAASVCFHYVMGCALELQARQAALQAGITDVEFDIKTEDVGVNVSAVLNGLKQLDS
ncbi:TetR family transcriptional regulator [Corynebacterium auriscanis]|uniref:TetR family transcriptional regulator n=1 Tax=Corynebacterium auriscanis TaxID=99807 RepID=UPI003CFAD7DB